MAIIVASSLLDSFAMDRDGSAIENESSNVSTSLPRTGRDPRAATSDILEGGKGEFAMKLTPPLAIALLLLAWNATHVDAIIPQNPHRLQGLEGIVGPSQPTAILGGKTGVRADTTWYGDFQIINGEYYARSAVNDKASVMWTFDRGNGPFNPPAPLLPNGEGWSKRDLTTSLEFYGRVIDNSLNLGAGVPPPIISGSKSLWIGADKPQTDALCWSCGAGYGNSWCQRVISPPLAYNGSGSIALSFRYFNKSEPCFDGTQVYLKRGDGSEVMLNRRTGDCPGNPVYGGGFTDSIGSYAAPRTYTREITSSEIGSAQNIRIVLEFTSDVGWSDEDGNYCTTWGPFGMDDLTIDGGGINLTEGWESGLNGWTRSTCSQIGDFIDVVDIGCYQILDPCECNLSGNVVEMHEGQCEQGTHPTGQHECIESPICDLGDAGLKSIFADLNWYGDLPEANGVGFRVSWRYYPQLCAATGLTRWSDLVAPNYYWMNTGSDCVSQRWSATEGGGVPPSARMVRCVIELLADCAAFTVDPCSGVTNPTPFFDNIAVGVTGGVRAPVCWFTGGTEFQDTGSYLETNPTESGLLNPRMPGPANGVIDIYYQSHDQGRPVRATDTLTVIGPTPSSTDPNTRWESRLWWRVARRAPFNADRENGTTSKYKIWRDKVADGKAIDRPYKPQFTYGWMDSVQAGPTIYSDEFSSTFRENDDDFAGEGQPTNEMIWDDVLYPGTRIEYFATTNYVGTPNYLTYIPDTTGGNFMEFEILPGLRTANVQNCGGLGFNTCAFQPAILYIEAGYSFTTPTATSRFYIENALRTVLNGYAPCLEQDGCTIPEDRNWDRYDYYYSWVTAEVPFARGAASRSNNGMTLSQILGYQAILLSTGSLGDWGSPTNEWDYQLYDQWLISSLCNSNNRRQVFVMNGDKCGQILTNANWTHGYGSNFLGNTLGAILVCNAFNGYTADADCQPQTWDPCVRWMAYPGGAFSTEIDVDAWGNSCPEMYGFNVYSLNGTAHGNRYYQTESGDKISYFGQITNENLAANANYRTVLDGVSWNHMSRRSVGGGDDCPRDTPSVVGASLKEIGAALKWGFGVSDYGGIPKLTDVEALATCQGTWNLPSSAEEQENALVDRLYGNEPNPFNPRTNVRFSLSHKGTMKLLIYDVSGRRVKTLVDGLMEAGLHTLVWDGTNDEGKHVGSGIYWAQMQAGAFVSNRKMVVLK
jgi:hypothetical protein